MTQLIENKPPRPALIATLLHFSPSECLPARPKRSEGGPARPKWNGGGSLITPFLIDRGCRLEIDITNLESAPSIFLTVAESRFLPFATLRKISARRRRFSGVLSQDFVSGDVVSCGWLRQRETGPSGDCAAGACLFH